MKKNQEVPGNAYESARLLAERVHAWGQAVMSYDYIYSVAWRGEVDIEGLSLRSPRAEGGEWLCTLRGFDSDGTPVVAFHSALSAIEALAGAGERWRQGTLKWRVDEYRTK